MAIMKLGETLDKQNKLKTEHENFKSVLDMTNSEAKAFFMKSKSYCSLPLPPYINFENLLDEISNKMNSYQNFNDPLDNPRKFDDINYKIYINKKESKYTWRQIKIIHPVLYIKLVNLITETDNWNIIVERFKIFQSNKNIKCLSIPNEKIINDEMDVANTVDNTEVINNTGETAEKQKKIKYKISNLEQEAIRLSLDYDFLITTDISDCYSSIYTHTISWALHDKTTAKQKQNDKKLLGNICDNILMDMTNGQTNGIPQGSILMDFFAEILLGYIDSILTEELNKILPKGSNYKILRYRDDYKIFTEEIILSDNILKKLNEILIDFGLKLNASKTKTSSNIINSIVKEDEISWLEQMQINDTAINTLLIIHKHSFEYNNTKCIDIALRNFYFKIENTKVIGPDQIYVLVSLLIDMGLRDPSKIYNIAAIISILMEMLKSKNTTEQLFKKIKNRFFFKSAHNYYIEIWLQRMIINQINNADFSEPICKVINKTPDINIWNNQWIKDNKLIDLIKFEKAIDWAKISNIPNVINYDEIAEFYDPYYE